MKSRQRMLHRDHSHVHKLPATLSHASTAKPSGSCATGYTPGRGAQGEGRRERFREREVVKYVTTEMAGMTTTTTPHHHRWDANLNHRVVERGQMLFGRPYTCDPQWTRRGKGGSLSSMDG